MAVGAGWAGIEAQLRQELATLGIDRVAVFEKWGTLRCSYGAVSRDVMAPAAEACRRAEERSAVTCENCGRPGRERTDRRWVKTLCDDCPRVERKG